MHRSNPIAIETRKNCIEAQNLARMHANQAQHYMSGSAAIFPFPAGSFLGRAVQAQENAAFCYQQAWMRLERLLGIA
jgi:hypothetical protein